ncbi:MAG: prolipoprotein diacylglyceryl transferase [Bacteroidales bacterium]|nr:prolipoprotein diacylglyceryl transferase [Bacteroidales bacterium]
MTIIPSPQFDLIYIPVLILCAGLFVFSGLRQKYPVSTVAALTAFLMVLFVVGLKIISYPINEWQNIFSHKQVEILHSKYLPGGVIFVGFGLLLLKFILKIRLSILDSLILGLPLIGIVQRLDCLLSGCCYGTTTHLPWAIHYSNISPAFNQQVSEELIQVSATSSLGIHPTQLYYVLGFLLVFIFLILFRKRVKTPGSLALLGFILMAVSRFIIEFFREPVGNKLSSMQFAGVNLLQWIILALVLLSTYVLYRREKHCCAPVLVPAKEYLRKSSLLLFVAAVLVWNFSRILAYSEFFFLQVLIALSIVVVIIRLFQKSTIPALRYSTAATLFLTIVLMSQKSTDTIINNDSIFMPQKWWDVKASAGGGNYDKINYDCGGNETGRTPEHYSIVSGGFTYNYLRSRKQHLQAGLNLGKMYDSGELLYGMNSTGTSSNMNSLSINFINPYFKYDFPKFGFGIGYNFLLTNETNALPDLYFRAGRREKYFFDVNLADNLYSSGLAGVWQMGMGSGFGNPDKHMFRAGISTVESKLIAYADAEFLLYDRLFMRTTLDVGNKIHGMVGLKYQIRKNR